VYDIPSVPCDVCGDGLRGIAGLFTHYEQNPQCRPEPKPLTFSDLLSASAALGGSALTFREGPVGETPRASSLAGDPWYPEGQSS